MARRGGTSVTITGTNFSGATSRKFGSTNAASYAVNSETSITAVSSAGTGTVDVTVTTPNGISATSSADQFTYAAPTVLTAAASSITQTSATLNATVNPNGGEVSECKFEWGTTTSYGSSAPCSSLPGHGESPVAVSASLTGLSNKTTYHFRISATTSAGQSKGSDQTFTASSAHVYKNGVIGAEGKPLRTIGWGTLKLTNATLGEVECHDITAGSMENPTGGGSAVGKVQAFYPYECISESCKALAGRRSK
jgi:large repetitive protein